MPIHTEKEIQQVFNDISLGSQDEREAFIARLLYGEKLETVVNFTRTDGTTEGEYKQEKEENA